MQRRALVQWMVATGGLSAFDRMSLSELLSLGHEAHLKPRPDRDSALALTAREVQTVTAAAECIIPLTETPGATDAGVGAFVDLMLAEWYPAGAVARFREGLEALDTSSRARFGQAFAESTAQQQMAHMVALDAEVAALRRTSGAQANDHWFAMLKYLTVWGYCTSEAGMRETLRSYPRPGRYDGFAPLR